MDEFDEFDPRGGAPSVRVGSPTEDWTCAACTFLNPLALERCKMCDTPMPVMEVKSHHHPSSPPSQQHLITSSTPPRSSTTQHGAGSSSAGQASLSFLPSFTPSFPMSVPATPPPASGHASGHASGGVSSPSSPSPHSSPTKDQQQASSTADGVQPPLSSPVTAGGEKQGGSGPLRRRRTGSSKKSEDKAGKFGLSVQETEAAGGSPSTSAGSSSLPNSPQTPTNTRVDTSGEFSLKKKGRAATLFGLGRSKKKDTESSPEKEEHSKSKTVEDKDEEKDQATGSNSNPGTPEKEEGGRRRTGSLVGWVTRKGRRGTADGGKGDTKEGTGEDESGDHTGKEISKEMRESGELSEVEEENTIGADWRTVMSTKRSVLMIVDNLTDETMMRRGAGKLNTGEWGRYPPAVIPAHTAAEFGSYGTNLKGTKGRCIYTVDGYESTFIFEWSNSKVGSPEIRCAQHPKEFKVEARGRIEKSAEITFSVFLAAGPKPKRLETPAADGAGSPPTSNGGESASVARDERGSVPTLTMSGGFPSGPVFDNLLDDDEVRAVEKFVTQTVAALTPREPERTASVTGLNTDSTSSSQQESFLPPVLRDSFSTDSTSNPALALPISNETVQSSSTATNPFLESNPFSGSTADWATADMDDGDWGEDEQSSPAPKFKFTIKSKEEMKPDDQSIPAVFKLSSPPPAASNSKQSRRRVPTPGREIVASASSVPTTGGAPVQSAGLVYRHTGPGNSSESTTPVTARAARLVQRKTGPVGRSNLTKEDTAPSPADEVRPNVIFEVGTGDSSLQACSRADNSTSTSPSTTPTPTPPGSNNVPIVPLSVATPVPAINSQAVIRQASNLMLSCGLHMQSGRFREAFADAESALGLLRSVNDINVIMKPLKICIDYKVAILVLTEIDTLNKHVSQTAEEASLIKQRIAHLAYQLASLRLTPQHAAISVRMAISRNIDAQNFGAASTLLQLVLSRNPPDAANLNEKLHLCKQMGETNAVPTINDPICFQTLQRVAQGDQLSQCPLCGSHFSTGTVAAGQRCPLCLSADVVLR